ncbi:MAG: hypothetical protein M1838_000541 [Thelocarpon superellum]|nr:MAG: hypothetical protein M1838_000541 [Thelocarpon superellum]
MSRLSSARYGKENVRVCKVLRDHETGSQSVVEMTVSVLLEGEIDASYTEADNSCVVATDSIKNTTYIVAKQNPVTPPELYASTLGSHFIETYPHLHVATVKVVTHRWTRMTVGGSPHPHSFFRDGAETRDVESVVRRGQGITIQSAIAGLLVLKSTGSQFHGFIRDAYTTLPETRDRILSTEVDCSWTWARFAGIDAVHTASPKFDVAWEDVRNITMQTFAREDSASVQNTMYKMSHQILAEVPDVDAVQYSLPNKHYFEIDLSWHKGLKNTGADAEVYAPQSSPNGLIKCTVSRDVAA